MIDVEGAILAGGASRRMGRDKAVLDFPGGTLLRRVAGNVAPLVRRLRVIGRTDAPEGLEGVPDIHPGLGPLAGIHTALATARAPKVLVVACDLPLASTAFLRALVERLAPGFDAVVPRTESGPVAVCAVYLSSLTAAIEERLLRRELAAHGFVASIAARLVEGDELSGMDPGGRCLLNVNTPAEYEKALGIAER